MAAFLNNLANVLTHRQKWADAETVTREELTMELTLHTNESPHVATTLNNLGYILTKRGQLAEAESYLRKSLAMKDNLHEPTGVTVPNLASLLKQQGKLAEVESLYRERVEINRRSGVPDSQLEKDLASLAASLRDGKKYADAEPVWREALDYARTFATNDPQRMELRISDLADCLRSQKKYAEAEKFYRDALGYAREIALKPPPQLPQPAKKLEDRIVDVVRLLELQDKRSSIEQFYRELVPSVLADQPESANILCARGSAFARRGQWKEAMRDLSRAIELQPTNEWYYHLFSPLPVAAGDTEAYHAHCARIFHQFGFTTNALHIIKSCLILPSPNTDLELVNKWADFAFVRRDQDYRLENHLLWSQYHKALAEYRRDNFDDAVKWAGKVLGKNTDARGAGAYLISAMAHHQLKHPTDARVALAKASDIVCAKFPRMFDETGKQGFVDEIIVHSLMREAKALIESESKAAAATK